MKKGPSAIIAVIAGIGLLAGCASVPPGPSPNAGVEVVFERPLWEVQGAVVKALGNMGHEIKKIETVYRGGTPAKIGYLLESGKQNRGVWVEALGTEKTRVVFSIVSSPSGVGSQKDLNEGMITEVKKVLGK